MRTDQHAPVEHEKLVKRIYSSLCEIVAKVVEPIVHKEKMWTQSKLVRRVVRHIIRAAKNPELLNMQWDAVVGHIVERAMEGYSSACGEKPWCYDIDLSPAFSVAAWEIISARGRPPVIRERLQDLIITKYNEKLESVLLVKGIQEAAKSTFKDVDVQGRIINALNRAYHPILHRCLADQRTLTDLKKIELFTREWLDESMQRAWSALKFSEELLTEVNVCHLFQNLMAPFSDDFPFSCVPGVLTKRIGQPPRDWQFIQTAVQDFFRLWRQGSEQTSRKKRKITASLREGNDLNAEDPARFEKEDLHAEANGHPMCTSAEDCIGTHFQPLVQHMLGSDKGDVYCRACWHSFLGENPSLRCVYVQSTGAVISGDPRISVRATHKRTFPELSSLLGQIPI